MAIVWTPTVVGVHAVGDLKLVRYNVATTGTPTYTTTGDSLTLALLGITQLFDADDFLATVGANPTTALFGTYNAGTQKVQLFTSNGAAPAELAELAAATNVNAGRVFALTLMGKGPVSGPAM